MKNILSIIGVLSLAVFSNVIAQENTPKKVTKNVELHSYLVTIKLESSDGKSLNDVSVPMTRELQNNGELTLYADLSMNIGSEDKPRYWICDFEVKPLDPARYCKLDVSDTGFMRKTTKDGSVHYTPMQLYFVENRLDKNGEMIIFKDTKQTLKIVVEKIEQ